MKKYVKRTLSLGMAGVLLFTGCGAKDEKSMTQLESAEYTTGTPAETIPETDGTESGSYEEIPNTAENESEPEGALKTDDYAKQTAESEEILQDSCSSDAGNTGEQKLAYTETADLYARQETPDGYLGSCYEFDGESGIYPGGEEYSEWEEKGFFSVMAQPLSTFSADVDTASYSNMRRLIREGYDLESLPDGAVRIEELINYFSYEYNDPKGMEPFGVTTQISRCPWNEEAELLMIGLKTQDIDYSLAPASNLVFLLDVSGSMDEPDKLPLLQESFAGLTDNLTKKDKVSIVTYAANDRIVLQGARGDEKKKIIGALNELEAGGGTYGSKGIETAYALAEENFIEGGNNRIILATDGDLNIGMTSEEELEELITRKKESGIFLSVLGFGTGNIKDNKMEILADKGNGNYAYIDCLREAKKVLVEEMTATLLTVCKDVKFQVEFNPDVVDGYRLLGYENRALATEDFDNDQKDGGEIGAGHSVTALYEIILCEPLHNSLTDREIDSLKYQEEYRRKNDGKKESPACEKEWLTISLRYKKPAGHVSTLLEYPVGYESYQNKPSEDFRFAAAVAEFGLLASHSAFSGNASLGHVKESIKELNLYDEYKIEFSELIQEME